jgi:hypothetical protein
MTTTAGLHHHLLRPSPPEAAAFVLAATGMLLVAALLIGEHAPGIAQVRIGSHPQARSDTKFRPVAVATSTTRPPVAVAVPPITAPVITVPAAAAAAPAPAAPFTTTCADASAYLASHQAPGFVDTCAPGSALGHYGYTCVNVVGRCEGVRIIHVACPAPFVYMNEAHNSWSLIGQRSGIDPYGQGSASEQAACDRFR